jgi:hypothetical protein
MVMRSPGLLAFDFRKELVRFNGFPAIDSHDDVSRTDIAGFEGEDTAAGAANFGSAESGFGCGPCGVHGDDAQTLICFGDFVDAEFRSDEASMLDQFGTMRAR